MFTLTNRTSSRHKKGQTVYICACATVFYKLAVISVENGSCLVVPVVMPTSALTLSLGKGGGTFKSGSP